jgi:hypothetical protein
MEPILSYRIPSTPTNPLHNNHFIYYFISIFFILQQADWPLTQAACFVVSNITQVSSKNKLWIAMDF